MIGDPLIVLDKHRKNAKVINDKLNGENKFIIVIYGSSGVGKTETMMLLQQELSLRKKTSLPISLDDYYIIHPLERNKWRLKNGIDSVGTEEIDWQDITRVCYDFKHDRDIKYKRTHKYCPEIEHGEIPSRHINYLIIEGLYGGELRKLNYGDLFVYLEGNPKQTLDFRQMRKKEDENDEFRKQIVQKEFNVICQLKKHADVIIEHN